MIINPRSVLITSLAEATARVAEATARIGPTDADPKTARQFIRVELLNEAARLAAFARELERQADLETPSRDGISAATAAGDVLRVAARNLLAYADELQATSEFLRSVDS